MPASVDDERGASRLDASHRSGREPLERPLSNERAVRVLSILEWVIDDQQADAVTRERTAYARREDAATLGRAPLVRCLGVLSQFDASGERVVPDLLRLRPRDVRRVADVGDRPLRVSREQSSDAVQHRLGLAVSRWHRDAGADRRVFDAIERTQQRPEVIGRSERGRDARDEVAELKTPNGRLRPPRLLALDCSE